jgi:hypothetical protein
MQVGLKKCLKCCKFCTNKLRQNYVFFRKNFVLREIKKIDFRIHPSRYYDLLKGKSRIRGFSTFPKPSGSREVNVALSPASRRHRATERKNARGGYTNYCYCSLRAVNTPD